MRTILIAAALTSVLLANGCTEYAGVKNNSDRYTTPEATTYAVPARNGQTTGMNPSGEAASVPSAADSNTANTTH
ncbi:MAG TPA: hypothetical protein VFE58_15525 [Tepidisphaeraceae bacterium]|jgi:hypothetical protein|nr:hypothetical protein [Tepidisphaeraceae bacterium]